MSIIGTQSNQTTGGPQPWEPGSIQDKGIDDQRKLRDGITSDSLLKPFSEINKRLVWEELNAPSTNPSLSAPLRQLRGANELGQGSSPTWGNLYDQLVEALPSDVKAELLNQKDQLFTNRDPSYAGFDIALQLAAQGMNQASGVNAPIPSNSAAEVRQNINYAIPGIALNSVLDSSLEVIQNVADLINTYGEVGDNFNLSLAQLEGVILGREQLIAIARQLIYPQISKSEGLTIQELASDPSAFTGATKLSGEGNGLGILSATLFALETVAFAASLKMGSPPLYLSLVVATKDSDAPTNQGGFVGPELQKIILGFTQTIDTLFGVRDRPGGRAMLEPLVTAFAAIVLGGAALIFEEGIGSLPTDSPQEKKDEQRFSAELTLKLIATSKTFDEIASGIVVTGEIPSSSQQLAANGLTLGTLLLVAYTASLQGGATQDSVLNALQPELQPLFEQLTQSGVGMLSPALGMFLQQGLLALQEGNPAALAAAMEQGLQSAGISPEKLKSDLLQMQNQANGVATGAAEGMDDKTDTGTSIQFVTA